MTTAELIYQESKKLPETEAREVLDFVEFLKAKQRRIAESKADMNELDQFSAVYEGNFDRNACYDRPTLR